MSASNSFYNSLRLANQLCDAIIRVDDVDFFVHKIVLCNCSSFFSSLFLEWSTPDTLLFDIPYVSSQLMKLIIEFIYTGFVPVTQENVTELFIAADRFDIRGILEACSKFLEGNLNPQNCIGIWWFTNFYYYPELKHKAFLYTLRHFEAVAATSEEFLQLPMQDLKKLIESDHLNVKKESTVFEAVMRWISYAPNERRECTSQLISKVRLAFLSPEYIMDILNSTTVVTTRKECKAILLRAMEAMLDNKTMLFLDPTVFNPLTSPRMPYEVLLAFGGWSSGNPTHGIEAYDVCAERWVNMSQYGDGPRAYHGTAFLNESVYCIGGFNDIDYFCTVHKFDLGMLTWQEVAPMHSSRCYVSVTVLDGYIYAMGGCDGMNRLETVERYEPHTNQWTFIASMHSQRSDACCTTLHGKIYICGGFNGRDCLASAEFYSPQTNEWTLITDMSCSRSGIGVIAYENYIYAVGGFDGNTRLCSVEAYNPETNNWRDMPSMLTPRSNFGIALINGCIFAVGGYNGFGTTSDAECFDAEAGKWSEVPSMKISRSALSCCVVYGLDNLADYIAPCYCPQLSDEEGS